MSNSNPLKFNQERTQLIAEKLADVLSENRAPAVEQVYALMAVLRWLGEALYDKADTSLEAVMKDFEESPTWPASLIIISNLPHDIRERFIREKENPGSDLKNLVGEKNV